MYKKQIKEYSIAGIVVQRLKLPLAVLESHVHVQSSPGCSTFDPLTDNAPVNTRR